MIDLWWGALGAVCAAFVGWRVMLRLIPVRAMTRAEAGIAARAGGQNRFLAGAPPDHKARLIVMPSPDLSYAACVFDLARGALRIEAPVGSGYWSLSLYAHNTDCFFVLNDRDLAGAPCDVVLHRQGIPAPALPGARTVASPTTGGIALIRVLVKDRAGRDAAAALAKAAKAIPLQD